MRTFHRLHLLDLLLTTLCVVLSTLLLFALSKPFHPQQQHTISNMLLVEMGGVEPPSRTLFSLLHTAI